MNRISPTVAAVAAGIFALLLIIYVFAGGSGKRGNTDKLSDAQVSDVVRAGPETRCSAQKTYDLIKSELFRQAADMRGDDAGTFSNVASYSFLRMTAPKLVGGDDNSGLVNCAGTVTLDLPPGLGVAGGRRSLGGDIAYAIRPATGGGDDVVTLGNADAIITPLSTLSRAGSSSGQVASSADQQPEPDPAAAPVAEPRVSPRPRPPEAAPAPRPAAPAPARSVPARPREPAARPAAPAPARSVPVQPREPAPRPAPAATAPRVASPSFNCRSARTIGEIAVCRDGALAGLDREMAGQFNRALSGADAGKRAQLQRSRTRFLRFRDSCGSSACIAGAYRDRMREIDDIMNERWSPR